MVRKNYKSKKGFTLIELLVVIAIIALLVSILLPSLTTAKELAQAVACQSKLRNCGLAWALYWDDYNRRIPVYTDVSDTSEWAYLMHPYLDSTPTPGTTRSVYNNQDLSTGCDQMPKGWDYWFGNRGTYYDNRLKTMDIDSAFSPVSISEFALLRDYSTYTNDQWGDKLHVGGHNVLFFDLSIERKVGTCSYFGSGDIIYDGYTRRYER